MVSMMHDNIFDMEGWHEYLCIKKAIRSICFICKLQLVCYRSLFVCCLRCVAKSAVAGCTQSQNSKVVHTVGVQVKCTNMRYNLSNVFEKKHI